jgi:putative transposase
MDIHATPRRRASNEPWHAHMLTFSCYRKYPLLKAERTCLWLAEAIVAARDKCDFSLWAYVFMPDHVHLIVHPRRPDALLSTILRSIKEPVGRRAIQFLKRHAPEWFPRLAVRRGLRVEHRFWQSGGGYDRNIIEPGTLLAMIDYIHLNPNRRGLSDRPSDWRWSSAAWFEGKEADVLVPDRIPPEWTDA